MSEMTMRPSGFVTRPSWIKLASFSLAMIPVLAGLYLFYLGWRPIADDRVSWFSFALAGLFYLTAWGVWKVRPWGFGLYFVLLGTIVIVDLYLILAQGRPVSIMHTIDFVLIAFGVVLFTRREIIEPYFNPRVRWWERSKRVGTRLAAQVEFDGKKVSGEVLDLSGSGCFFSTAEDLISNESKVQVRLLNPDHMKDLAFPGEIVRSIDLRHHGMRFMQLTRQQRRSLKTLIDELEISG